MSADRRNKVALAILFLILAGVAGRLWWTSGISTPASNGAGATATARRTPAGVAPAGAPEVHLSALDEDRPKPRDTRRNLFAFKPKPLPPPPPPPKIVAPPAP